MIGLQVLRHGILPAIAVGQQFLLVVEKLLVGLGGELEIGALHDGVNGACLLAETAVNALGHVNIVPRGTTAAIVTLFGLDGDGLRETETIPE